MSPYDNSDRYGAPSSYSRSGFGRGVARGIEDFHPDPYMKRDPFKNDDPYKGNDPYRKNDPYKAHDPYAFKDPYGPLSPANPGNRSKPCMFWFALKEMIQDIFNVDAAFHEEKRVLPFDKDLFRIRFLAGLAGRTFGAVTIVLLAMLGSYLVMLKATPAFATLVAFVDFMIIAWILYCPAHQTITAGAYAISSNSVEFYKLWKKGFSGYQMKIFLTYFVAFSGLIYFAYDPQALVDFFNWLDLEGLKRSEVVYATYFLIGSNLLFLLVYVLFAASLVKKSDRLKEENYTANVKLRKMSEMEKKQALLDAE